MTDWLAAKAHTKAHTGKGKKLEKYVEEVLKSRTDIDYERNHDAAASRGMLTVKRVGDFTWYSREAHGVIEAKELKTGTRLPYVRLTQYASMLKRMRHGGKCEVVVYCAETELYYSAPIQKLKVLREASSMKSWDLRDFQCFITVEDVIKECLR